MDRDHVRVLQPPQRAGLADQPLAGAVAVEVVAAHQLERDLAIELGIVRGVDHAHAALAQGAEQDEAPQARRLAHREQRLLHPRPHLGHARAIAVGPRAAQRVDGLGVGPGVVVPHAAPVYVTAAAPVLS